jgi:hypothetical protein
MSDVRRSWDEERSRWRGRTQRYKGDPLGAIGMLRRRFATRMAGVDTGASIGIEYSLPVLQNAPWLIERIKVDETEFVTCPEDCPVNPPLSHVYEGRSNYVLHDAVVDTRSGFTYVDHLGRSTLVRESTSWPASQALWSVSRPQNGSAIKTPLTILSSPSNYFHFMTEDLPALLRVLEIWPDLTVGVRRGPRPRFVDDALRAIRKVPLELDRTIRAGTLHVAGRAQDLGYVRPTDQQRVRNLILPTAKGITAKDVDPPGAALFAARGRATRAGRFEKEARERAAEAGVTTIDYSALSLYDQASISGQAAVVIGIHGAALTNTLFCQPGSLLLELVPADYYNRCYEWLAHMSHLSYAAVDSPDQLQRLLAQL